jgi:monofunctional biosynthetic peptidoglycan transglycosylase
MEVRGPFGSDYPERIDPPTMPTRPTARTAPVWPPVVTGPPPRLQPVGRRRRWLRALALMVTAVLLVVLGQVVVYRFVMPPWTPAMAASHLAGAPVAQRWVPIEHVSPWLIRAVIASEDARFCAHHGVDLGELKAAVEEARTGASPRGASTITMQVVKNVFLWPGRSYLRKAIELPLAVVVDALWPKRRIMEVYLNIAEWGPGLYGIEAAARHWFKKSAAQLNAREAAQLAVVLPDPAHRDPRRLSPWNARIAQIVGARMARSVTTCIR